jgi:heptosyltransferase II
MKILIRGTNWIGDAVMSVPAMREIRRLFPEAHIALQTRPWAKDIFADSALFDEIIELGSLDSKITGPLRQAEALRPHKFDLGVLFPNSFASAFIARLGNVRKRVGYATDGRSFLLTDPIAVPKWKSQRHEVYYYLNLVGELEKDLFDRQTVAMTAPAVDIPVSERRRSEARELLSQHGVDRSRPIVALAPGSTNSRAKRWHAESFAALSDRLQNEHGTSVILIGAADEAEISDCVLALSTMRPVDLTGKTTLSQAGAILSEIDLLVCNDMGLAHLAPAVGTKTLVIFGPTDHVTTRPFSPLAEIARAGVECSPCMLRDCPIDHRCMTRVAVSQVFDKARTMLI